MPEAKRRLSNIEVEEVSLVDAAANKRQFLVLKAASKNPDTEATMPINVESLDKVGLKDDDAAAVSKAAEAIAKLDLSDEQRSELGKLFGFEAPAPAEGGSAGGEEPKEGEEVATLKARVEALEKAAKGGDTAAGDTAKILKSAIAGMEKAQADAAEAKKAAAEEREARLAKEYAERAAELKGLDGKPEDIAKALRAIDALPEEERGIVTKQLETANTKVLRSEMLKAAGRRSEIDEGSAEGKIEAIAKAKMEADPKLTRAAAIAKAADENPDLYRAYNQERAG